MAFRHVSFGDPEYDGPYLRADRGDFDGPERVVMQTDFLEKVLHLRHTDSILDAGCGIGTYTHELARRGYKALGLDISATFLAEAEKHLESDETNPKFRCGSYRSLEVLEEEFTVVIITATLFFKNAEELRQVCEQVFSVLSLGGRFLFDYSNWQIRSKADHYPDYHWWRDGDAFIMLRNDWDDTNQQYGFEWFRIDATRQEQLYSSGRFAALAPNDVIAVVRSVGFDEVVTLPKWEMRPFDESRDRGLVLIATK